MTDALGADGPGGALATSPLRVGVNLLWLVPGVVGGSEEYLTRTVRAVHEAQVPGLEVHLFVLRPFAEAYPDLVAEVPTHVLSLSGRSKPLRIAAESTWLAAKVRALDLDLVHYAGGVVPPVRPRPATVAIHDLQPLDRPESFSRTKLAYLRRMLPRSARAARVVCVPSEFASRSVTRYLGVDPSRIVVVPHPLPSDEASEVSPDDVLAVRARYGLDGPYLLYPAMTHPHKNHRTLLHAVSRLRRRHHPVKLVLTSGTGRAEAEVEHLIRDLDLGHVVVRTGRVSRADLDALTVDAAALTFPSHYEGFGAPVLEAMALGCPVLAADATALPEVVDGAGILLPPDDADAWAEAITDLLDHPDRAADLVAEGRARAATFTRARTAAAVVAAWRQALAEPADPGTS